jgi:hypothetical protein
MAKLPVIQRELIQLAANLTFSDKDGEQYRVQKLQARQVALPEDLARHENRFGTSPTPTSKTPARPRGCC